MTALPIERAEQAHATVAAAAAAEPAEPLWADLSARGLGDYEGLGAWYRRMASVGAELAVVGRSHQGRPLVALTFGASRPVRRAVVVAGLHALEWIGVEVALAVAAELGGMDLSDRAVTLFPCANPDGVAAVEADLRAGRRRFRRGNARGVDLNRNFDAAWGRTAWPARALPLYRPGRHALSEPETAAIAYALGSHRVDRALSLHAVGGFVLYPSGHRRRPVADREEHRRWARSIGRACSRVPYPALPAWKLNAGQRMGGMELDWFHERHGALSLLVECSRGNPPGLEPFAMVNPRQPSVVARRVAHAVGPFVRGEPVDRVGHPR